MSSHTDGEWTILNLNVSPITMEASAPEVSNETETFVRESTINAKSSAGDKKDKDDCTCAKKPIMLRENSLESIDEDYRRPRADRVPRPRHYTPSPRRYPLGPDRFTYPEQRVVNSSAQMLEQIGKEDGIMELPAPARGSFYLTTYPFGTKDVKKWAWLLASGIEDEYLAEALPSIDRNGGRLFGVERVRQHRDHSPVYIAGNIDLPSAYLSRALDTDVVSEDTEHAVRYLIVIQNRHRPRGAKLLVAESRKAAGIAMYYEILKGDSVMFVGATVHQCKSAAPEKYRKVASLEEAVSAKDEGYVGIIC